MTLYKRKSQKITPKRIFICTEGSVTEPRYFNDFIEYFRISQAHVIVIPREDSLSSPSQIIDKVNQFVKEQKVNKKFIQGDEFWLVLDTDSWGPNLHETIDDAVRRKYKHAVSNPCFEIWFLLHYKTSNEIISEIDRFDTKSSINMALHQYPISGLNKTDYIPKTDFAIQNEKELDFITNHRVPQSTGTHVYRLIEEIKSFIE